MKDYDPVECLREEVNRFKATNTFTPLLVTGFYVQAGCVLNEIDGWRKAFPGKTPQEVSRLLAKLLEKAGKLDAIEAAEKYKLDRRLR